MFLRIALTTLSIFSIVAFSAVACEMDSSDSDASIDGHTEDGNGDGPHFFGARIEDMTDQCAYDSPGADIDSICLHKGDEEYCASAVEDSYLQDCSGVNNDYYDVNQVLGASDGQANSGFCSLGGEGGWIVASFGNVELENGDHIIVHEIAPEVGGGEESMGIRLRAISTEGDNPTMGVCNESPCDFLIHGL